MMNKRHTGLLLVFLLAAVLRIYQLGANPPGLDWDETSIGYNAYSLLKTGKDEYGNSWPISIRSFNDYKPPFYTYLTIPSIALFGLTEFAVRFPSALAGTLTVLVTYLLVKELFDGNKKNRNHKPSAISHQSSVIALLAAFLLAISPWHLQFSRVAFEANLALFLFIIGVYLLIRAIARSSALYYAGSATAFVATMYSYHSTRVVVPLFVILMGILHRKTLMKQAGAVFPALGLAIVMLLPTLATLTRGAVQARFTTVSIFTNPGLFTQEEERLSRQREYREDDQGSIAGILHHRWLVLSQIITKNYFDHFNLEFLFLRGDGIGRHSTVGMGLLYFWELPFLLAGAYLLVKNQKDATKIIFPWLAVAPAASALTTQTPHAVRALLMLPPLLIITACGILQLTKVLKKHRYLLVFIGLFAIGNFLYYLDLYYIHTPVERSHDWQFGYKELVEKLTPLEEEVNEIIVTTRYDQPYIYVLFYKRVDPLWYQRMAEAGSDHFGKYFFRKIVYQRDRQVKDAIIVGSPEEIPDDAQIFDTIQFLDGNEAFRLART